MWFSTIVVAGWIVRGDAIRDAIFAIVVASRDTAVPGWVEERERNAAEAGGIAVAVLSAPPNELT